VIAGRDDVNVEFEQLFSESGRDSETSSGILAIGDDEVDASLANQPRKTIFDDRPPWTSKNVTDEKNAHEGSVNFDGNRELAGTGQTTVASKRINTE